MAMIEFRHAHKQTEINWLKTIWLTKKDEQLIRRGPADAQNWATGKTER